MFGATRAEHRVVIIDDHVLFAESLELALSLEGYDVRRLELPDEGGSMATLRSMALRSNPRTVILDLDLGRFGDGVTLIPPLARAHVNVVVVTASQETGRWGECMRLGARKVLSKSGALQQALSTVRRLHQGLPVVTREELEFLLNAWANQSRVDDDIRRRLERLTPRERQVLGAPDRGTDRPGDLAGQRRLRGNGPHPGEVDPQQARGLLAAGRGRHGQPDRMATGRLTGLVHLDHVGPGPWRRGGCQRQASG